MNIHGMAGGFLSGSMLLCAILVPGQRAGAEEYTAAQEQLFRQVAPMFHKNFSAGEFEKNGPLVTEDIDVDSNNVKLVGRDAFVERIKRYSIPFPGMQLKDRVIVVDGNVAAVNYVLQGEHKGPFGTVQATGRKIEAMSGEVFEFSKEGLMKKLITVTELDKVKAEVAGRITVGKFMAVSLLPNGQSNAATRIRIKTVAASLDGNFNDGKTVRNADLLTEDVTVSVDNKTLSGRQAVVEHQDRLKQSFPDMRIQDEYVLVDGMRAAVEFVMEGTQTGPFVLPDGSTLPPTGKKVRVRGMAFLKFADASHIEEITYVRNGDDFASQLTQ